MDYKTTLYSIFAPRKTEFAVPGYQRAYAWEADKQVAQFLTDIKEHPEGLERYHFGHFLFEITPSQRDKFWIIDGQQRLTTAVLFLAAICRKLAAYPEQAAAIHNLRQEFLVSADGRYKFRTVDYDNNFYINLVIEDRPDQTDTSSRRRLQEAFHYFQEALQSETLETILKWKNVLEDATITTDTIENKAEAIQVFTFQNDRGKDLTNLEKLKATLMLKLFLSAQYSAVDPNDAIHYMEREFESIYKTVEQLKIMDEDGLLNYHTIAFLGESDTSLVRVKKAMDRQSHSDLTNWIKEFVVNLKSSFLYGIHIQDIAKGNNSVGDLLFLDRANSFPLLLKLLHYHHDLGTLTKHLRLIEIILFRLTYTTGRYYTNSLPSVAYRYQGDAEALKNDLLGYAQRGFKHYWSFERDFIAYLQGDHHYTLISRYLLWKYENSLRKAAKEPQMLYPEFINMYGVNNLDTTLDHWAPQNPEAVVYDDEFKERFLHNIGNLVLSSRGRNSRDNNSLPNDRTTESVLLSRQALEPFRGNWGKDNIKNRQIEIVNFALTHWNPELVL